MTTYIVIPFHIHRHFPLLPNIEKLSNSNSGLRDKDEDNDGKKSGNGGEESEERKEDEETRRLRFRRWKAVLKVYPRSPKPKKSSKKWNFFLKL